MYRLGEPKECKEVNWGRLVAYRRGMEVSRWHTCQPIFPETVGHHSANVALLVHELSDGEASRELLYACLIHDVGEFYTGDMPAPVKKDNTGLKERLHDLDYRYLESHDIYPPLLPESEKNLLRAADILDLLFTARLEMQCGNTEYLEVFQRGLEYLAVVPLTPAQQAKADAIVAVLTENVDECE